jgi:hypothetical protein
VCLDNPAADFIGFQGTPIERYQINRRQLLNYLGLNREEARFEQGSAHEVRHTLGLRLWGRPGPWDYNVEVVYQLGTFGQGQIHAWTATSDTGYTLRTVPWQPRLGLKADIISGGRHPKSRDLRTFNLLFPKGAYFGEIALIGPANLLDVHPSLELHPMPPVTVSADWDVFWRQSLQDGIYGNAVHLLRSGQQSQARLIGSQASVQVEWQWSTLQRSLPSTVTFWRVPSCARLAQGGMWTTPRYGARTSFNREESSRERSRR